MSIPSGVLDIPTWADPALGWPEPDIEWHVYNVLRPLGNLQVWSLSGTNGDPPSWQYITRLQVDVRGQTRKSAWRRADMASRMLRGLQMVPWDEGVVNWCSLTTRPMWMPDQVNGPRYVLRCQVWYHPNPARRPAQEQVHV